MLIYCHLVVQPKKSGIKLLVPTVQCIESFKIIYRAFIDGIKSAEAFYVYLPIKHE